MFDYHYDLFARVLYEIAMYYMQQGICYSTLNEHCHALFYFYFARKLVMRANLIFHPDFPIGLQKFEQCINDEQAKLPQDIVQVVLKNLHNP